MWLATAAAGPPLSDPPLIVFVGVVLAFPLVFVAIWCGVCALLALASGYRGLLQQFAAPAATEHGVVALPAPYFVRFGLVSYKGGIVTFDASPRGLGIQVMRLFPFHPPLRIPWERISVGPAGGSGWWRRQSITVDGRVTLHISEEAGRAVVAQQRSYLGS